MFGIKNELVYIVCMILLLLGFLILNVHNTVDFVLPALVSVVWTIPLATKEQLELYEGMQRKKAILLLPHGE